MCIYIYIFHQTVTCICPIHIWIWSGSQNLGVNNLMMMMMMLRKSRVEDEGHMIKMGARIVAKIFSSGSVAILKYEYKGTSEVQSAPSFHSSNIELCHVLFVHPVEMPSRTACPKMCIVIPICISIISPVCDSRIFAVPLSVTRDSCL